MPLVTIEGTAVDGTALPVHVSTFGDGPLVRAAGVRAHRADPRTTRRLKADGLIISDPATTWAQLGAWNVLDLVALGDFLCRVWRPGPGRPNAGKKPLTTVAELRARITGVRRRGIRRLREAAELIREDSWSPRPDTPRGRRVSVQHPLFHPLPGRHVYEQCHAFTSHFLSVTARQTGRKCDLNRVGSGGGEAGGAGASGRPVLNHSFLRIVQNNVTLGAWR